MINFKGGFQKIFSHIPIAEKMLFAKHLSIMIKSGMPLLDSLWLLKKQARSKSFQRIMGQMVVDIDNGQFLSASLDKFRAIFGEFFISIIRVGEASGTLAENLNYLHQEIRKSYELRKKIKSAMIYPIIILIATAGIGSILIFFVFPKIMPIFSSLKIDLPLPTRMLIFIITVLTNYTLYIAIAAVLSVVFFIFIF